MNLNNEAILDEHYENPKTFIENVTTLNKQLPAILDDFVKYFVFYNRNPNYPEYQSAFENIKTNVNSLSSSLFMVSNNVEVNIDKINKQLLALDVLIKKERLTNIELKKKLGIVEEKSNSATEMIHNYSEIYDIGYLRNWGLLLSIIIVGITITKVFTSSQISLPTISMSSISRPSIFQTTTKPTI